MSVLQGVEAVAAMGAGRDKSSARAWWSCYRWAVAGVLLAGATFKAWSPASADAVLGGAGPWLEVGLAVWLVGGWWPEVLRAVVVLVFSLFTAWTARLALSGAASCGCFGAVEVPPWVTAMLDVAIVFAGCAVTPGRGAFAARSSFASAVVGGAAVAVVGAGMILVHDPSPGLTVRGDTVAVDPGKWVGEPLPIRTHLVGAGVEALDQGEHLIVLHRHNCHACEDLLREVAMAGSVPLTLIAADAETCKAPGEGGGLCLDPTQKWLLGTPAVIHVQDGQVLATAQAVGPSLALIRRVRSTAEARQRQAGPEAPH